MKFEVFSHGQRVERFALHGAYLFGTDGISVRRARIGSKNGLIECKKPNLETVGMALLWPVEGFGRVLLPTTCLPERERPYNLNLEIARAKLMQITNKREDWSFFDTIEGTETVAAEAQGLFIEAIQSIPDAPRASRLADEALKKAMVLSERVAVKQGRQLFGLRSKGHGLGRGSLGCCLDPASIANAQYLSRLFEAFGLVQIPIKWADVEARRGKYDFGKIDTCVSLLNRQKVLIAAGPLLHFSKRDLPEWLLNSGMGFEKMRETAYQFVSQVVARYVGSVHRWCVVSGLNAHNQFNFNFEQTLEMTRAASMAAKAASPRAHVMVEVVNPWGDYFAVTPNSIPPLVYMDMVVQSGIHCDAFGLQMRFGKNESGMHIRDMMQISAILDSFGPIAKPVHITDVQIPSRNGRGSYEGSVAGVWYKEWDPTRQSQWIDQFCRIALSKPFVEAVTYANLHDSKLNTIPYSGLLSERFEPKESFATIRKLKRAIGAG